MFCRVRAPAFTQLRRPTGRRPEMLVGQLTDDPVRQAVGVHPALFALGIVPVVRRLPEQLQCDDDRVFRVGELDGERRLPDVMQRIEEVSLR